METVSSFEARDQWGKILDRVIGGEHFTVTRHGRPVAVIVPAASVVQVSDEERRAGGLPGENGDAR